MSVFLRFLIFYIVPHGRVTSVFPCDFIASVLYSPFLVLLSDFVFHVVRDVRHV